MARLCVVAVLLIAACSSGSNARTSTPLTVFAAASLTEAFTDAKPGIEADRALRLTFSFAGSGALVTQVEQGAPADVVATADAASMQQLVDAGDVEPPVTFATNQLEILVGPGNPKGIHGLADLARPDIVFVTEDESVPAGRYSAQVLQRAGVVVQPRSKEADVKAAVARVTSGEADATVVYATDVRSAGTGGEGVPIPAAQNVIASYPVAIVKATAHHAEADAFIEAILHGRGHDALLRRGFLAA